MKSNSLFFIILIGGCFFSFTTTGVTPPSEAINQEELYRAMKLNTILEKDLRHLEEINSILQYLGQAINKGSIQIENKDEVRKWLRDQQKVIHDLQNGYVKTTLNEPLLKNAILTTKFFVIQTLETLRNSFTKLSSFDIPPLTRNDDLHEISLEELECSANNNTSLLGELKEQADLVGLTPINLLARKLDSINNKYAITGFIEDLPMLAVAGAAALYFTPKTWLEKVPLLQRPLLWLQGKVGCYHEREDVKKTEAEKNNKELEQNIKKNEGFYHRFFNLSEKNKWAAIQNHIALLGTLVAFRMKREDFGPYRAVKGALRSWWSQLKGYAVEDNESYKIIDDLNLDDERLIGLEDAKEVFRKIVLYIAKSDMYDRANTTLPKAFLLEGPSGCGKTFIARALAGHIFKHTHTQIKFKEIKWREAIFEKEGIKTILEKAKLNAPCVLFLDELHNLPVRRMGDADPRTAGETLSEFLTALSGINSENDAAHQVFLLAATNRAESIDKALRNRFYIIPVRKPTYDNRKEYFEVILKRNAIDTSHIDSAALARQTFGSVYRELDNIVKDARFTARTLARTVSQEHLQTQVEKRVYKLSNTVSLKPEEQKFVAAHLAGHTLLYTLLDTHESLELVTLYDRARKLKEVRIGEMRQEDIYKQETTKYGGIFTYNDAELLKIKTKVHKENECKMWLAGALAEELLLGTCRFHSQAKEKKHVNTPSSCTKEKDFRKAYKCAKEITFNGQEKVPAALKQELTQQAYNLVKRYEQEIKELLIQHKPVLEKIARELEDKKLLRAEQIRSLIEDSVAASAA